MAVNYGVHYGRYNSDYTRTLPSRLGASRTLRIYSRLGSLKLGIVALSKKRPAAHDS